MVRKTLFTLFLLVICCLALIGCGPKSKEVANDNLKNIFGQDNRENIISQEYPWTTIGRLDSGCTGTLVGKKLVLTAAHCVLDSVKGTIKPDLTYFRPNFIKISSPAINHDDPVWIDYVWYGSNKSEENRAQDWAILRLAKAAGEKYGWMSIKKIDFAANLPFTTNLAGYSADRNNGDSPFVHRGCYIHQIKDEKLLDDCDSTSGISGGPLFNVIDGNAAVVAIAVSEYRKGAPNSIKVDAFMADQANVAISAASFIDHLDILRKTIDAEINSPALSGVFETVNPNVPGNPGLNPDLPDPSKPSNPSAPVSPPPDNSPHSAAQIDFQKVKENAFRIEHLAGILFDEAGVISQWAQETVSNHDLTSQVFKMRTEAINFQEISFQLKNGKNDINTISTLAGYFSDLFTYWQWIKDYCEVSSQIKYDPTIDHFLHDMGDKLEEIKGILNK